MLSNYEQRILTELEVELTRHSSRRASWLRALRLPVVSLALVATTYLSVSSILPRTAASLAIALLGIVVGWLLVGVVRRRIMGPRIRRRLRKLARQRRAPGQA
jgi:hypothetical protein